MDTGPLLVVRPRADGGRQAEHLQVDGVPRGGHLRVVDGGRRVALLREDLQADTPRAAPHRRDLPVAERLAVGDLRLALHRAVGDLRLVLRAVLLRAVLLQAAPVAEHRVGDLRLGRHQAVGGRRVDLLAALLQPDLWVEALRGGGALLLADLLRGDGALLAPLRAALLQDGAALLRAATGLLLAATAVRPARGIQAAATHRAPAVIRALLQVAARATLSRQAMP